MLVPRFHRKNSLSDLKLEPRSISGKSLATPSLGNQLPSLPPKVTIRMTQIGRPSRNMRSFLRFGVGTPIAKYRSSGSVQASRPQPKRPEAMVSYGNISPDKWNYSANTAARIHNSSDGDHVGIVIVVSVFGILGIVSARAEMRVQNSARLFAVYIEKARADSVRRHAGAGQESVVQTFAPGSTTFNVTMDFDGTGNRTTRTLTLESGVFFTTVAQTATFDWRGRVVQRLAFQISNGRKSIPVDISGSGDITVDDQIFADDAIPAVIVAVR